MSIIVQHLLQTPQEFAAIPIRTNPDGSVVRIKDIGRTELGTERSDIVGSYNGKPSAATGNPPGRRGQCPGYGRCRQAKDLKEMSRYFPSEGMKVIYPYDTTPFTKVAIEEVVKTLFEAILLVFVIMYLFMGNVSGPP